MSERTRRNVVSPTKPGESSYSKSITKRTTWVIPAPSCFWTRAPFSRVSRVDIVLHTPMSCLLPFRRTTPAALAAAGGPRASHKKTVATRKPPRKCPRKRRKSATAVKQNPPTMAANLDSMFIWLIGLACLVASTEAQPAPPPAAPPVVCGPGTTLDANSSTCEINCDENNPPSNPPGRRLSESPFAPADADASDTARESREQSARAGKAIDSYLASQPDLDDALRSVLSSHLKRFAAEILYFTEEE